MRSRAGFPGAVIVAALLWAAVGARAQGPPAADPLLTPYAKPGVLADVGGGRRIHLVCSGAGGPTVILTAGLGNWSEVWRKVQPELARKTRVCAWDRAGFGFSSPSGEPQDVAHTTADLAAALRAARIGPPYVLVGHSLGGYESLLFADRRPREVVGMVLVDPSIPDQARVLADFVGPEFAAINRQYNAGVLGMMRRCEAGVRAGTVGPGKADPDGCLRLPGDYPEALKAALAPGLAEPAKFATMRSLIENVDRDGGLVVNRKRGYGRMPLVVLTAGLRPQLSPQLEASPEAAAGFDRYQTVGWREAHERIARLSARGAHRMVEGSGHYIQLVKPEAVIAAVDEVLAAGR